MLAPPLTETIANLLEAVGIPFARGPHPRFDFTLRDARGRRVALVARDDEQVAALLPRLLERVRSEPKLDAFWLITREEAPRREARVFQALFSEARGVEARWIGANALARELGMAANTDLRQPEAQARLQVNAFTAALERYAAPHIGLAPNGLPAPARPPRLPARDLSAYQLLARQFSYATIAKLAALETPLEQSLRLGGRISDVIIVLSDIKNFSAIARAARPEELNELMSDYYRRARDLVWRHGGTLDKFIGDAVLAVFNYPLPDALAAQRALHFSADLIALGRRLLDDLGSHLDERIDTGTRVGLSSGDLWALNLSRHDIEVSFVGDKINLAARLEKTCVTDGALLSNRMYHLIANSSLPLDAEKRAIEPQEAKGQIMEITAWQFGPEALAAWQDLEGRAEAPLAGAKVQNAVH